MRLRDFGMIFCLVCAPLWSQQVPDADQSADAMGPFLPRPYQHQIHCIAEVGQVWVESYGGSFRLREKNDEVVHDKMIQPLGPYDDLDEVSNFGDAFTACFKKAFAMLDEALHLDPNKFYYGRARLSIMDISPDLFLVSEEDDTLTEDKSAARILFQYDFDAAGQYIHRRSAEDVTKIFLGDDRWYVDDRFYHLNNRRDAEEGAPSLKICRVSVYRSHSSVRGTYKPYQSSLTLVSDASAHRQLRAHDAKNNADAGNEAVNHAAESAREACKNKALAVQQAQLALNHQEIRGSKRLLLVGDQLKGVPTYLADRGFDNWGEPLKTRPQSGDEKNIPDRAFHSADLTSEKRVYIPTHLPTYFKVRGELISFDGSGAQIQEIEAIEIPDLEIDAMREVVWPSTGPDENNR